MKCFNCGCDLSDKDFCTSCGEDVRIYKKIIRLSNTYYNDGLAKAGVRDLSGSIVSLRKSLKFNKKNIKARNLLGLVYYETGEVVAALREWVISKNIQSSRNIAGDYIKAVQSNQNRLETINTTIKKYNQALMYCRQGSEDLAIIQLKKVLSLNPNLVSAHQLLALLYMKNEEYDKSKKELNKAVKIDTTNTITLRYMKELETILEKPSVSNAQKAKLREERISYRSGNETIIQPMEYKENTGFSTVINVVIGLAVGVLLSWFLIMPARIQSVKNEANKSVVDYSDQIASKTAAISDLESQLESSKKSLDKANKELESYKGESGVVDNYTLLIKAMKAYDEKDMLTALNSIEEVNADALEGDSKDVYEALYTDITDNAAAELYNKGYAAYKTDDFDTTIENLSRVIELDETNGNALYVLGRAYQKNGDQENANKIFALVIERFPGTEWASNAQLNTH